ANAPVSTIDYVHNEHSSVSICANGDCAASGEYSAEVTLDEGDNQITVTANTDDGAQASVNFQIKYQAQEVAAPVRLSQCSDQRVVAANGASAAVSFSPTVSGGCSAPTLSCDHESGSIFTIGNHTVSCEAYDECGQTAECDFAVNIEAPPESEEVDDVEETEAVASCDRNEDVSLTHTLGDNLLWPPKHKLVDVEQTLTLATDCDQLQGEMSQWQTGVEVWSNEPEASDSANGMQDSGDTFNFAPDAKATDEVLRLRAERLGNGNGRVYLLIGYGAEGDNRFLTSCEVVVVPHNNSSASKAEVAIMASQAKYYCEENNGAAPVDFYQHGLSDKIGSKQ
ncbi:MAG TPA: HYR domain-containing protein, partial [Porticoccus sp.]|nr:HYR domain-containing protein [Porticoccus sp.]